MTESRATSPDQITEQVLASFEAAPEPRLKELLQSLTRHLHAFAVETRLTEEEWLVGVKFLTAVGQSCTDTRQETILLSDTLGLSMVVDAVNHPAADGATESTVLGPFYVPESPERDLGGSIVEIDDSGEPAFVSGQVLDTAGAPIAGATLDVWQNNSSRLYAVQDGSQPPTNLRGKFRTDAEGHYRFWSVRPTDYTIPDDGPVGEMLRASGRHPWRAAHLHLIVSAPGHEPVATHVFDDESRHLDSDTVFGVKASLVSHYAPHEPGEPGAPAGHRGTWYTLQRDFVLKSLM